MCGICGELRFGRDHRVAAEDVLRMRETLEHRGPDSAGLYLSDDGRAGLGFRRLRIIDLTPNANQPLANEDGSVRIVFNGEIYNYRELRRGLEGRHQFRSQSDTEVIVHLYEEKGADAIAELDGMFALAIWDERKQRLLLARDRAGKKPLFYARTGDQLVFASEIKALFQHPDLTLEPDPAVFPSYFLHGYVPSPRTVYKGVRQIEPASYAIVSADGAMSEHRYWQLQYPNREAQTPVSPADARTRVRHLVEQAVARRLVSDVPLGAFLSGGVDSSIVVGIMSQQMSSPVKTFSIGFEGDPAFDETSYAREAAQRFGTDHTEFRVTPSAFDLVEKLVWHHDGPFGDASAIPTYIVSKLTREHVTVALTGDGGDELFAGYTRFPAAVSAERIPAPVRRVLGMALSALPEASSSRHPVARARRFGQALSLPLHERMTRWISLFYDDLEGLFNPDCLQSIGPIDRLGYLRGYEQAMAPLSPLGQLLYSNYSSYLLNDLLVKMDRCSMANSLETRSPFLDRELTEYVALLPDGLKLDGWRTKAILQDAFADLLPSSIQTRAKMGFGVPLDTWLRGDLREYLQDMLLAPDVRYTDYLSRRRVESLVRAHVSGQANLGLQLWTLLTFEVWLRLLSGWKRPVPVPVASAGF